MWILIKDELKYYIQSRFMIYLFAGFPAITLIINFIAGKSNDAMQIQNYFFILINLTALISSILIASSTISDIKMRFYPLLIIRNIKPIVIILNRFLALSLSILSAIFLSVFLVNLFGALFLSFLIHDDIFLIYLPILAFAFFLQLFSISAGVFIGIASKSLLTAILIVFFIVSNTNIFFIMAFDKFADYTGIHSLIIKSIIFVIAGIILSIPFLFASAYFLKKKI